MVNSAVANVGRWSALAFGLVYGYTHNITLQKQAEEKHAQKEYHRKELLIEQAKAAYAKQQAAAAAGVTTTTAVSSSALDVESPDFDFEKFVAQYEEK